MYIWRRQNLAKIAHPFLVRTFKMSELEKSAVTSSKQAQLQSSSEKKLFEILFVKINSNIYSRFHDVECNFFSSPDSAQNGLLMLSSIQFVHPKIRSHNNQSELSRDMFNVNMILSTQYYYIQELFCVHENLINSDLM